MITAGRSVAERGQKVLLRQQFFTLLDQGVIRVCAWLRPRFFRRRFSIPAIDTEKNFFSARVHCCGNFSVAGRQRSQRLQHRYSRDRLVQCFRQAFDCAQPHAQPGKRSRPRRRSKPAEVFYSVSMLLEQSGQRGNELRGKSSAGNRPPTQSRGTILRLLQPA